ncbi:MAG: acetyl-CoA carboxylase carboxyl transferase subunit alpha, partial [Eubacteriales bacterium]|nr:acetyl-CoA carboxylase carboxyl transferase subunit alpha [Eubacteriales bacterium]
WKDPAKAPEAAACLKLTADDLLELGIIERKIRETEDNLFQNFKKALTDAITLKTKTDTDILLNNRYNKFRKI